MKIRSASYLSLLVVFFCVNVSGSVQPLPQWTKTLPVEKLFGQPFLVSLNNNAGYAVAGSMGDRSENIFLLVTDNNGNEIFRKTLSTFPDNQCIGAHCVRSFLQICDNGFIMAGTRKTRTSFFDAAWFIRIDREGNILWTTVLEADEESLATGYTVESLSQSRTGTFIVTGQKEGAAWVCCLERNGEVQWSKTFDGAHASSVEQSADGGFLVSGISYTPTLRSVYLHKIGADGALAWTRVSSSDAECADQDRYPQASLVDEKNNTITAITSPKTGNCCVISYDMDANRQWEQCLCFCESAYHPVKSLVSMEKNGYLVAGDRALDRLTVPQGIWLVRLDKNGGIAWQWTSSAVQVARAAVPVNNRGVLVLAERYSCTANELVLMMLSNPQRPATAEATPSQAGNDHFAAGRPTAPVKMFDIMGRLVSSASVACTPASPNSFSAGFYVGRSKTGNTIRFENMQR